MKNGYRVNPHLHFFSKINELLSFRATSDFLMQVNIRCFFTDGQVVEKVNINPCTSIFCIVESQCYKTYQYYDLYNMVSRPVHILILFDFDMASQCF